MTVGSYVNDRRYTTHTYALIQPQGWYVNEAYPLTGFYESKTWTGTDYPPVKPTYEKIVWQLRDGRKVTTRRRVDVPTRRKSTDHPYSMSLIQYRDAPYSWDRYEYGSLSEQDVRTSKSIFSYGYITQGSDEWNSNDDLAVIGKLREAVAGSDFNMGVFLGEGHQALKMITESATRIRKGLSRIKRGDVAGAAKALGAHKPGKVHKTASANWLQLQYGWLPLVKDAQGAAEFLAKLLNFPMIQTYKVRKRKPIKVSPIAGTPFLGFWGEGNTRVQIIARLEEVNVAQLSGLTDPASVLWELTPYSFVADWFIPIGNYLAARSLASALTGTFVTTKTRRVLCAYEGLANTDNGIVKTIYTVPPRGNTKTVDMTRTVSTSLQVPVPTVKTLDKIASWQHCANAVALLVQKKF